MLYRGTKAPAKMSDMQSDTLSTDTGVNDEGLGLDMVWEGIDGSSLPSNDR